MRHRLIVAALGALIAGPAFAQDSPPPVPAPKPVREKKVCRAVIVTGSMMRQSVCRTRAQWAQTDADNQRNADDSMSSPSAGRSAGREAP